MDTIIREDSLQVFGVLVLVGLLLTIFRAAAVYPIGLLDFVEYLLVSC